MKKINIGGLITYSKEIKEAIKKGLPIVALESSIISHGMPYPHSLEMAKEIEDLIRSHGARPATLAILDGRINVGLDAELLDAFAKAKNVEKVSSNNFEATMFSKKPGGTTVAGSLKICDLLSIKTFVTGGIGGVHRDFDQNFDVSPDLHEIKSSNVITISAGPKSILDVKKTFEAIETLGIQVFSIGQKNLPAFWYQDSGIKAPFRVESPLAVSEIFQIKEKLNNKNGILVCNPIPKKYALKKTELEPIIETGLKKFQGSVFSGKKLTPAILNYLFKETKGETLKSNIELVKNNAIFGSKVALGLN
ncbi:MAG: pseudouridine-5-phosphate glycosidase [Rhodobacteraceae bacterium]|nr:MAG: pseudouridine-5-phosphate glycosidase [Paracoccaceae bacterium]